MHKLGEVMQVASENDDRRGAGSSFARHLHLGDVSSFRRSACLESLYTIQA